MRALYVFLAVALMDYCWARYIRATAERRPLHAGGYAAGLLLVSALVVVSYVEDHALILPAVAGAFVGTYLSVRYGE